MYLSGHPIAQRGGKVPWAVLCPKIPMLKSQLLVPQNVTEFGNRIFKEEIKLKGGH